MIHTGSGFDLIYPSKGRDTVVGFDVRADCIFMSDDVMPSLSQQGNDLLVEISGEHDYSLLLKGVEKSDYTKYINC